LVTLTGLGGVGKTRLALEVAADLAEDFAGGAAFVDLSAVRDRDLVVPADAQVLGGRQRPGWPLCDALAMHCTTKPSCWCWTTLSRWRPPRRTWRRWWRPARG
jgi:predicted ATPase